MGRTTPIDEAEASPLTILEDGRADGYFLNERCMGTYLHGILDNPAFIDFILAPHKDKLVQQDRLQDYEQFKNEQYDKLANHLRQHLDIDYIYSCLKYD